MAGFVRAQVYVCVQAEASECLLVQVRIVCQAGRY